MDEFNFGTPGRRGPKVTLDPRLLIVIGGLLAAALAVAAFLSFVSRGGEEVAEAQATAVKAVDIADDRRAQATLRNALVAAKTAYMDLGSYEEMSAADLAALEPSLTYTDGPSPNAQTVSVAFTADGFGAAAMSSTGTCFTIGDDGAGGITYGTATTCTGESGLLAAAPSW